MSDPDLKSLLGSVAGDEAAASHQGVLLGRASAAPATAATEWPAEVLADLPDLSADSDLARALGDGARAVVRALDEGMLTVDLLLPADDQPLAARTAALAQWCQGFLVGLAAAGVKDVRNLPGNVPEFLSDVLAISKAVSENAGESDEQAFAEIVEYLKVGVQLVHDELAGLEPSPTVQ